MTCRSWTLAVFVGVAFAACSAAPEIASDAPVADRTPADPAVLMEADREFARDVAERGTDAWVEAFAEDGALLIPGGEIRGLDAIRAAMAPAFDTPGFSLTWEPTFAEISADGDFGYTIGRARRVVPSPDGPVVSESQYTTIWKLDAEGRWKVTLDVGVPDPEPAPPE